MARSLWMVLLAVLTVASCESGHWEHFGLAWCRNATLQIMQMIPFSSVDIHPARYVGKHES